MERHPQLICNEHLLYHITANLQGFTSRPHEGSAPRQAAVAVTVVDLAGDSGVYGMTTHECPDDAASIILTMRAARLRKHAGQWALPGGRMEPGEQPEDAALRELAEEVGLELDRSRVLGRLDDYTTRSGFVITPVVVWGGSGVHLRPDPEEVQSIHRIPIAEFMRPDSPMFDDIPESPNPVLMMPVGHSWIAAPTAALVYQFREVAILGKATRVAHYEQPYFAWR